MAAETDRRALADIMRRHIHVGRDSDACVDRLVGFEAAAEEIAALRAADAAEVREPDAEAFARRAHAGQTDRAGQPYTGHLGRFAARARAHAKALGLPEDEAILCGVVGWLHDTVEDTFVTCAMLATEGFSDDVVSAVYEVTRPDHLIYRDFIDRILASGDRPAMIVKLADLEDNTDPARPGTASLSPSHRRRYEDAKATLRGALEARPVPDMDRETHHEQ